MTIEPIGNQSIEPQSKIDPGQYKTVGHGFEAVFLQSMLKTSCIDQHFTNERKLYITPSENELPQSLNTGTASMETATVSPQLEIEQMPMSQSLDDFVKTLWPYAKQAGRLIGLDPKMLMAQVALETGWGQFIAKDADGRSSNNLFNIKANHTDPSVQIKTTEYIANRPVNRVASFKKYPSVEHGFKDYISLIQGARYESALANAHDPQRYMDALHQAGYATDPNYTNKVLSIYHGDALLGALERNGCNA